MSKLTNTALKTSIQALRFLERVIWKLERHLEPPAIKQTSTSAAQPTPIEANNMLYKQLEFLPSVAGAHTFQTETYKQAFRWLEERGVHLTPNHFYYPIPDTRLLMQSKLWDKESELPGVDMNLPTQLYFLRDVFPGLVDEYNAIPKSKTPDLKPYEFHFNNNIFDEIDPYVYYGMIRHFRPKTVLEVGSGWSTRLAARAALKNGDTRLVSIEPYPDSLLKAGFPGLHSLIEQKVEDVDLSVFQQLDENDILFIDTSHVVRTGGDVNYLYLEVLPRLHKGVVVHIHDIFFPEEYPRWWITERFLFWNEQYLLQAFLAFNSHFKVQFANNYMRLKYLDEVKNAFPNSPSYEHGQSLWMQKVK